MADRSIFMAYLTGRFGHIQVHHSNPFGGSSPAGCGPGQTHECWHFEPMAFLGDNDSDITHPFDGHALLCSGFRHNDINLLQCIGSSDLSDCWVQTCM
jgi:hypothetical protein